MRTFMSALGKGRASSCSRAKFVAVLLAAVAVLVLLAVPAFADGVAAEFDIYATVVIPFIIATWFIEAAVLNYILKLGYRRCFSYSLIANLASFFLGLIWVGVLGEAGWKEALIHGEVGRARLLLLRSFVVTVAEEGLIILLLVGKQRDNKATLAAVPAANALTYAIGAPLLYYVAG
jgi:hypothetical protein